MAIFTNRVFDTVAADFVEWDTAPVADFAGTSYPGPGTFGVNTSDFVIARKTVTGGNFSFKKVASGTPLLVPKDQQMAVHGTFTVEDEITLLGEIVLR